jgi:hypothetical protein
MLTYVETYVRESLIGNGKKILRRRYAYSMKIHGGNKQDSQAYGNILAWTPNCEEVLTRACMNGRLYHMKYDTSKH